MDVELGGPASIVEAAMRCLGGASDVPAAPATDARAAARAHPGLRRFAGAFMLSPAEVEAVGLLVAVELRAEIGRAFDRRTGRTDGRPTVAALAEVASGGNPTAEAALLAALAPAAHLVAAGLVQLIGDGPFAARSVRIPDAVWPRIVGMPARLPFPVFARGGAGLGRLELAPSTREQAERAVARARTARATAFVVVHGAADDAADVLGAVIAAELDVAAIVVPAAAVDEPGASPAIIDELPLPGVDERRRIWERHLVRDALAPDVDLGEIARRVALAGGDIRNAAATALVLAAADAAPVAMRHLVLAVWREVRKSGRLVGADDLGPWREIIRSAERR